MFNYPLSQLFDAQGIVVNVFDADTYAALLAAGHFAEKPAAPVKEAPLAESAESFEAADASMRAVTPTPKRGKK